MQGTNNKIFLITTFALGLLAVSLFFTAEIGIHLSFAASANTGIPHQSRNEISEVKAFSDDSRFSSNKAATTSTEKLLKIFGSETPSPGNADIQEIDQYITDFFAHVDGQSYMKSYGFVSDSRQQFEEIIAKLSASPPTVTRETDSFKDVCKNVFYFYRILGKERILFLKDVLANESDIIEPMMTCFYRWLTRIPPNSNQKGLQVSVEQLCGFAGFFLETFGGRSYLFRRSAKVRTLISYYCILAVSKADREGYNPYGLDIRPHIELVFENITQQRGLDNKDLYLGELSGLRQKYNRYSSR